MRVFVSSTSEDLGEHRDAAMRSLRRLGHEIVAMEDFTAVASYPLDRVLELVRECDAFLGLVAWRHGYVPDASGAQTLPAGSTAGETSITEFEYLAAKERGIPCLMFLLAESAAWPPRHIDGFSSEGTADAIKAFRGRLMRDHIVSFFTTPEGLEGSVATAIANTRIAGQVAANLVELQAPVEFGDAVLEGSQAPELTSVVTTARRQSVVTIDIATGWWSTRLFLLGFLLQRLTDVQRVLITEGDVLVGLVSIDTIVDSLLRIHPELAVVSQRVRGREAPRSDVQQEASEIVAIYEEEVQQQEWDLKLDVGETNLRRWFGEAMLTSSIHIESLEEATALDLIRLLDYPSDFVPVQSKESRREAASAPNVNVNVIDTRALTAELARSYVSELLDLLVKR
ncbi:MAG: DUF4062 domain-containing protein [Myxococcota bacterium]|nr:DUF4062 domain-containing protein [Myxococcota bacterium]